MYRITPQSTTNESHTELWIGRRSRSRFDMLKPRLKTRVLNKQNKYVQNYDTQLNIYYCGDAVLEMNFIRIPKWIPGVLQEQHSPVSK